MIKAFELRIYPNKEQTEEIARTFGICRFVHNKIIAMKKELWEDYRLSYTPSLKGFKEEWPWIKDVSSQAVCCTYNDTLTSYKNFFKTCKGENKAKQNYPKFKKKSDKQSYRIACTYDKHHNNRPDIKIIDHDHIIIPKLGILKFKNYKDQNWSKVHILNVTIKKTKTDKYFVSLCGEVPLPVYKEPKFQVTAFDLGIKDYCIFESGEVEKNPKFLIKAQKKLAVQQRRLSRCVKESKGYEKQRLKVAKIHEKVRNQRKDFQHKLSSRIVSENQVIISEDLNVKGMLKNHNLAKAISDAAWSTFLNMIKYKSEWSGRTYIKVSKFFPSTKLCHHCGFKYKELKLKDRIWICPNCGKILYRDKNAAINLLNEGLKIYNSTTEYVESGSTELKVQHIVSNETPKPINTGYIGNLESEQSYLD